MKPEDKGKVVKVKGIDELILDVDQYGGFVSIEVGMLVKPLDEVFSEEALVDVPVGQRKKLFIEHIADDTEDKGGHRRYAKYYEVLIDDPEFGVKLDEKGIDKAKLKQKFKDKQEKTK
jgi:hypothetical protein